MKSRQAERESVGEKVEKQFTASTPLGAPPPPYPPPLHKDTNRESHGLFGNLRKLVKPQRPPSISGSPTSPNAQPKVPPPLPPRPEGVKIPSSAVTPPTILPNRALEREKQSTADVTSTSGIERNVQQAINACKPTFSNLLQNRQQMTVRAVLEMGSWLIGLAYRW